MRFGPAITDPPPNYFTLGAGSAMLIVREVYSDWASERRGMIAIRRADTTGAAPPSAEPSVLAKRYGVAGKILLSRLRTFLAFPEWFYLKLPVNTLTEPRSTPGGLATQFSSVGHYDLDDDQAMIVTVPAASRDVAPYQGIQLGSSWYISLDYINHQTSLTADQARPDPDGRGSSSASVTQASLTGLSARGTPEAMSSFGGSAFPVICCPRTDLRPKSSASPRLSGACLSTRRRGARTASTHSGSRRVRPRSPGGCWAENGEPGWQLPGWQLVSLMS